MLVSSGTYLFQSLNPASQAVDPHGVVPLQLLCGSIPARAAATTRLWVPPSSRPAAPTSPAAAAAAAAPGSTVTKQQRPPAVVRTRPVGGGRGPRAHICHGSDCCRNKEREGCGMGTMVGRRRMQLLVESEAEDGRRAAVSDDSRTRTRLATTPTYKCAEEDASSRNNNTGRWCGSGRRSRKR